MKHGKGITKADVDGFIENLRHRLYTAIDQQKNVQVDQKVDKVETTKPGDANRTYRPGAFTLSVYIDD